MTASHDDIEGLCALAASGQLTQEEFSQLSTHCDSCNHCARRLQEMTRLGIGIFLSNPSNDHPRRAPLDMRARFVVRAINEGVPLTQPRLSLFSLNLRIPAIAFLTFLLVVINFRIDFPSGQNRNVKHVEISTASGPNQSSTSLSKNGVKSSFLSFPQQARLTSQQATARIEHKDSPHAFPPDIQEYNSGRPLSVRTNTSELHYFSAPATNISRSIWSPSGPEIQPNLDWRERDLFQVNVSGVDRVKFYLPSHAVKNALFDIAEENRSFDLSTYSTALKPNFQFDIPQLDFAGLHNN